MLAISEKKESLAPVPNAAADPALPKRRHLVSMLEEILLRENRTVAAIIQRCC
jgi:hypothetical protein